MTQEHPITPPPELVKQWATANGIVYKDLSVFCQNIAIQAARWGADMELNACCEWLNDNFDHCNSSDRSEWLRAARRPQPPSLKERASQVVDWLIENGRLNDDDAIVLRQLVESLPS